MSYVPDWTICARDILLHLPRDYEFYDYTINISCKEKNRYSRRFDLEVPKDPPMENAYSFETVLKAIAYLDICGLTETNLVGNQIAYEDCVELSKSGDILAVGSNRHLTLKGMIFAGALQDFRLWYGLCRDAVERITQDGIELDLEDIFGLAVREHVTQAAIEPCR